MRSNASRDFITSVDQLTMSAPRTASLRTAREQSPSVCVSIQRTLLKETLLLSHCLKMCVCACDTEADELQLSRMTNEEVGTVVVIHNSEL